MLIRREKKWDGTEMEHETSCVDFFVGKAWFYLRKDDTDSQRRRKFREVFDWGSSAGGAEQRSLSKRNKRES